jgi:hypothetical protein
MPRYGARVPGETLARRQFVEYVQTPLNLAVSEIRRFGW